ncbi:type II toxin-antitoxin system RelE/ParE family toxin [Rhizobium sp. YS-1r]|uniref:type II toxin-antitoxin system RelE/ParE family toxin n=1 Tax=Rhizobium sp. YS-1r TaxID=1532558 RepID=UPI00050E71E8|nr:type II toxin-antitoxin system RelE/ParE family toxin [Rhizobium sp. YS-1r]KGD92011.1 plasmid stabilization protein [Rhizobium sp. YS-1r]
MAVAFSPAAVQDLEEIGDYIHTDNPIAAYHVIAELRVRCNRLVDMPRMGVPRPELWAGLRAFPFRRYVVFYTVEGEDVRIERILHGARDIETIFGKEDERPEG